MDGKRDAREYACRRPLLVSGLWALATAVLVLWLPQPLVWCCLLLPAGMLAFRSTRRFAVVVLALAVMMAGYRTAYVSSVAHLDGHSDTVTGQVMTAPTAGGACLVRVTSSEHVRPGMQVALFGLEEQSPGLYDTVTARVRWCAVDASQRHYAAQGVHAYGFLEASEDALTVTPSGEWSLSRGLQQMRDRLVGVLRHHLPAEESGVLAALCFGERDYVVPAIQRDFQGSGLSHLLVVSGLHVSAVAVAVRWLFRRLRVGKGVSALLSVATIWLFALLVGTTPSVLRAATMCTVWLVGDCLFCRSDGLNSLGLAALLLLAANPYTLYNVSFQLSFGATAGVLLLAPRLAAPPAVDVPTSRREAVMRGCRRTVRNAAAVSASALLFTLPIATYHYGGFPLLAISANVLTVGVAGAALLTGWLGGMLGWIPFLSWAAHGLLLVAGRLADYLCLVARWMSPDWAWVSVPQVWQWLLVMVLCGVTVYGILCRFRSRRVVAGLITLLVLAVGIGTPLSLMSPRLTVLAAGEGGGVLLQQGTHRVLLVAHSDELTALQNEVTASVDAVVVAQGAITRSDLSDQWADTVFVAAGAAVQEQTTDVVLCSAGNTLYPWKDSRITVLNDAWLLVQAGGYATAVCVDPTVPCPVQGVSCIYLGGIPDAPPADAYTVVCSEAGLRRHRGKLTGRETIVTQDCITFVPRMGEWSVLPWL